MKEIQNLNENIEELKNGIEIIDSIPTTNPNNGDEFLDYNTYTKLHDSISTALKYLEDIRDELGKQIIVNPDIIYNHGNIPVKEIKKNENTKTRYINKDSFLTLDEIKLYTDFTGSPGLRWKRLSPYSGEEFNTTIQIPSFENVLKKGKNLTINLNGVLFIGDSFLKEISTGLLKYYSDEICDEYYYGGSRKMLSNISGIFIKNNFDVYNLLKSRIEWIGNKEYIKDINEYLKNEYYVLKCNTIGTSMK